jgi:3-dehydroquinate synthase
LRHGEAVAIGIALDARYSVLAGLLPTGEDGRVHRLLTRLGFRLWDDALDLRDERRRRRVVAGLADFQEHLGGELTITLLEAIGRGIEVHVMDETRIEQSIRWLKAQAR